MNNWIDVNTKLPDIPRDSDGTRLISNWVDILVDNKVLTSYYHVIYGWMIKDEPTERWVFGYKPINGVTHWKL